MLATRSTAASSSAETSRSASSVRTSRADSSFLAGSDVQGPASRFSTPRPSRTMTSGRTTTSDGPVDATIQIGGRTIKALGAWVVVAPPNFAPGLQSVVTIYDVLFEVATKVQPDRAPLRPSFTRQIYPLLDRHVQNQWVNEGMAKQFGWGAPSNFLDPSMLAALSNSSGASQPIRTDVFRRFRNPDFQQPDASALPPYYGDNTNIPGITPRQWMAVLPIQYRWLQQWANGDFDADWPVGGLQFPDHWRISHSPSADGARSRGARRLPRRAVSSWL